jgi:3-hydroxy-9,10-secoandrosta-1,3,5(10)-triene-9,17-dione monooxygenase reductase component
VSELADAGAPSFDVARFREVLGHFATGVTVVTGLDADGPVGFTCQAFAALSLEPPLVVMAPSRTSESFPRISRTGAFCVNVLTDEQEAMARVFATKGSHKFDGVGWKAGSNGAPVLSDCLAWVECRLESVHEGGDHLIAVGSVTGMGVGTGRPLVFYRGGFGSFEA